MECKGKFSGEERCNVFIFGKNDPSHWYCPLHEHQDKIKPKTNQTNEEANTQQIKNDTLLATGGQETPKQETTANNKEKAVEPNQLQTEESELKAFEETLNSFLNNENKG